VGGTTTAIVSYQDSHNRSYFEPKTTANPSGYSGDAERTSRELQLWADAVNTMKSSVSSSLDIDGNKDGWIDEIFFVIKGSNGAWGDILWPHAWGMHSKGVTVNGVKAGSFMCVFETWHDPGLLCHETGHVLGAPDLYRYTNGNITPVASWDLMAHQTNPGQSMSAYTKLKYMGFINNIPEIHQSGYYTLSPLGSNKSAYKIPSTKAGEYFVVEYRKKTSSSYESLIPGSGLVIYRLNSAASGNGGGPPDEIYVYRPDGTNNETNGNISNAFFSLESGRTTFTDATSPKGFMSDNTLGHLNITDISSAGNFITFFYKKPYCLSSDVKAITYTSASTIPSVSEAIQVINTSGAVTVISGSNVTFRSELVKLQSGFRANSGSTFRATTPNCGNYQPVPAPAMMLANTTFVTAKEVNVLAVETAAGLPGLSFDVYPNPASEYVNILMQKGTEGINAIEVYSSSGQKIKSVEVKDITAEIKVDLHDEVPGIYYVKAVSGGQSATKKVVIK
jgi:M6 family metalloprotease-like protein